MRHHLSVERAWNGECRRSHSPDYTPQCRPLQAAGRPARLPALPGQREALFHAAGRLTFDRPQV